MIVRINPIDLSQVAADGGWPSGSYAASVSSPWPDDARAYELLILSQDEKNQPLGDDFRQHQLRQMIPQAAIALTPEEDDLVARLDGHYADSELQPAWHHLTEADGSGAFAFSPTARTDPAVEPWGSVRIAPSWRRLAQACADPAIGFERSVRLRLFAVAPTAAASLVEVSATDDDRWPLLLSQCHFFLSTTPELKSLQLVVRQMDTTQVKAKVMQRLMAVARGEPAIP
jgi:hypothetical protein